jgi:hypothetical protein
VGVGERSKSPEKSSVALQRQMSSIESIPPFQDLLETIETPLKVMRFIILHRVLISFIINVCYFCLVFALLSFSQAQLHHSLPVQQENASVAETDSSEPKKDEAQGWVTVFGMTVRRMNVDLLLLLLLLLHLLLLLLILYVLCIDSSPSLMSAHT